MSDLRGQHRPKGPGQQMKGKGGDVELKVGPTLAPNVLDTPPKNQQAESQGGATRGLIGWRVNNTTKE